MIRYAIIENEVYARDNLRDCIRRIRSDYSEVFSSDCVEETVKWLRRAKDVDVMFLDIELNDGRCFDIFKQINTDLPVVFTTAYDEFMLNAFRTNSIDYILKPITEDSLRLALEKFERLRRPLSMETIRNIYPGESGYRNRILISKGDEYRSVPVDMISIFLSEDKYVIAYTKDGDSLLTNIASLNRLIDTLNPSCFFQVSRNAIVAICAIRSVSKYFGNRLKVVVSVGDGESKEVIVSMDRKKAFLAWFGGEV